MAIIAAGRAQDTGTGATMAKQQRTSRELQEAIMHEVRRQPEWNNIPNVTITKRTQTAPRHPNWDAAFTMHGPRVAPEGAFRLIGNLQSEFDLA
jgi:hypothetical protein